MAKKMRPKPKPRNRAAQDMTLIQLHRINDDLAAHSSAIAALVERIAVLEQQMTGGPPPVFTTAPD